MTNPDQPGTFRETAREVLRKTARALLFISKLNTDDLKRVIANPAAMDVQIGMAVSETAGTKALLSG